MGVDILNPARWVCPGMELKALKKDFDAHLCFHGGIENQKILPFDSPQEVWAEVGHNIESLARDRAGYILAPCHNIQTVTPAENIIGMDHEADY